MHYDSHKGDSIMREIDKMNDGKWYDANHDPLIVKHRLEADDLCFKYNQTKPSDIDTQKIILEKLKVKLGEDTTLLAPVYMDYGYKVTIGSRTFINHNAYFMDGGGITIGSNCFVGPNCGFYTATHPLIAKERNTGLEKAHPITIEDNVWIGGDVTILPGVTVGEGSVIGAKSLVNKDIPQGVIAVGNPIRILRKINPNDSVETALSNEN